MELRGMEDMGVLEASIVNAGSIRDFNEFDKEEKVTLKEFGGYKAVSGGLKVTLPKHSVVMLRLK